jgi:hypothetical protein
VPRSLPTPIFSWMERQPRGSQSSREAQPEIRCTSLMPPSRRPRSTPDDVVARVLRERTEGKTAYAIARDLNRDAVPTAQGALAWSQATVRALLMGERVH